MTFKRFSIVFLRQRIVFGMVVGVSGKLKEIGAPGQALCCSPVMFSSFHIAACAGSLPELRIAGDYHWSKDGYGEKNEEGNDAQCIAWHMPYYKFGNVL